MNRRRLSLACALTAFAAFVPAGPAAADPVSDPCWMIGGPTPAGPEIDVDGDGNPEATLPSVEVTVCARAETGLPEAPVRFQCYGGLHSCDLRITTGHSGSGSADADACVAYNGRPYCTSVESGTIPVVPVEETTTCVGWSLDTACMGADE
ncbi:MAG TPA: hypothetical protein VHN37_11275 [Actinomycetota bacterium]|nr:hypothetical protein [Actinomycetota bacterium]